jgi:beta-lactamase regulating signal transducer with metallopeptidase domain
MTWLVTIGLTNAVIAALLGILAYGVGRWAKWPALTHVLWVLVLIKLLAVPVFDVPIGLRIDPAVFENAPRAVAAPQPLPASAPLAVMAAGELSPPAENLGPVLHAAKADTARPSAAAARLLPLAAIGRVVASPANWLRVAVAVWIVGAVGMALLYAWRTRQFRRYLQRAARADAELTARVAQLARAARLPSRPRVVTVESTISPMLYGLGRSVVLIFPAALNRQLAPAARDTLLLHELAHYARGDHWVRLVELLTQVVFWWHPVVWWARRELEAAEEECCDAWVVERQAGVPRLYAEALLATIDFLCETPTPLPPVASGLGDVPLLRARLTQIIRGRLPAQLSPAAKAAVFLAALFVLPVCPSLFGAAAVAAGVDLPVAVEAITPDATQTPALPPVPLEEAPPPEPDSEIDMAPTLAAVKAAMQSPLQPSFLYATAVSPDRRFKVELRKGYQATLLQTPVANQRVREPIYLTNPLAKCISFSPDSNTFAAGHDDGEVWLYDSHTGVVSERLRRDGAPIRTVAYSPDGKQLAAGTSTGSVVVWDLRTGVSSELVPSGNLPAICIRWSQDGRRLAISLGDDIAAPNDSTLVIYSTEQGGIQGRFALTTAAAAVVWLADDREILIADYLGQATIRQVSSGWVRRPLQLTQTSVSAEQWSADCPALEEELQERLAP